MWIICRKFYFYLIFFTQKYNLQRIFIKKEKKNNYFTQYVIFIEKNIKFSISFLNTSKKAKKNFKELFLYIFQLLPHFVVQNTWVLFFLQSLIHFYYKKKWKTQKNCYFIIVIENIKQIKNRKKIKKIKDAIFNQNEKKRFFLLKFTQKLSEIRSLQIFVKWNFVHSIFSNTLSRILNTQRKEIYF
jgi:hypothetical protein